MLNIALITDIHYGPDRGSTLGSRAPELFDKFRSWLSSSGCALVVDLGDRISDADHETERQLAREVGTWFSKLSLPRHHLAGNRDLDKLSLQENEQLLGAALRSASIDRSGFHLVFWNPGAKLDREHGFSLDEDALAWLKADLSATRLPTVIFTHVPLDNGSMVGNFYFEKAYPRHASYPPEDGARVREVLERSGKVVLCVNGHAHWNTYHCVDGIHYVTIPSLTETYPTYPKPCESWAKLALSDSVHLQVFGNLPLEYRFPLKRLNSGHWLNPDKEYAPRVTLPR